MKMIIMMIFTYKFNILSTKKLSVARVSLMNECISEVQPRDKREQKDRPYEMKSCSLIQKFYQPYQGTHVCTEHR